MGWAHAAYFTRVGQGALVHLRDRAARSRFHSSNLPTQTGRLLGACLRHHARPTPDAIAVTVTWADALPLFGARAEPASVNSRQGDAVQC
jgi:hypothetical protein